MVKRPKTSVVGGFDAGLTLYNTTKLRSMNSELSRIRAEQQYTTDAIRESTTITLTAIKSVADLQIATIGGLVELDKKLETLSSIAWEVKGYLERKEERENFVNDLKLIVLGIEDELEKIQAYSEDYMEYAIVQVEDLQAIIKHHDVKVEHFASLSIDQIKWAKRVIESVELAHYKYNITLGG